MNKWAHIHHTGKCIRRFGGIYAYCRYFIDRKWYILVLILYIEKHVICLKDYRMRSFLSIQYVHGELCKHLGIDSSTDHPDLSIHTTIKILKRTGSSDFTLKWL